MLRALKEVKGGSTTLDGDLVYMLLNLTALVTKITLKSLIYSRIDIFSRFITGLESVEDSTPVECECGGTNK